MKTLLIWLAIMLQCLPSYAGGVLMLGGGVTGSTPSYTYIFTENFEGTGFPSTYFSSSDSSASGIDYDYTTTPPEGSQSCFGDYVSTNLTLVSNAFASQTTLYVGFRFEATTWVGANGVELMQFYDNLNTRGMLQWNSFNRRLSVVPYGGTSVNSEDNILSVGNQYYIKVRVVTGTGTNSTLTAWYSTNGTSWTQLATSTDGTFTGSWERIGFLWKSSGDYEIDDVRVSDADFNY